MGAHTHALIFRQKQEQRQPRVATCWHGREMVACTTMASTTRRRQDRPAQQRPSWRNFTRRILMVHALTAVSILLLVRQPKFLLFSFHYVFSFLFWIFSSLCWSENIDRDQGRYLRSQQRLPTLQSSGGRGEGVSPVPPSPSVKRISFCGRHKESAEYC